VFPKIILGAGDALSVVEGFTNSFKECRYSNNPKSFVNFLLPPLAKGRVAGWGKKIYDSYKDCYRLKKRTPTPRKSPEKNSLATGKMALPQKSIFIVGWASCLS
jgi:hypothetical protein